jgi:1-deoxy-D-xylulose-5-phosphate reductoisomerase
MVMVEAESSLAAGNRQKTISVLGATGSIGTSTLDLVAREPERFRIVAMAAMSNVSALAEAARQFRPDRVAIADATRHQELAEALSGTGILVTSGTDAVVEAASVPVDIVVGAIVGRAGLEPTLAALRQGTTVALATKECLVVAGSLTMKTAARYGATLLPVDSEHNAIFQCFETANADRIERIILTASGGPFRTWSLDRMRTAKREEALKHPNWTMGAKVTIDSATLMNKGLEVIEAHHLFAMPGHRIEVLVHPQSIVHGMVGYTDGSMVACLGSPDMRTPIAHCLNHPARGPAPTKRLDLAEIGALTFEKPDLIRFPALRLAYEALEIGGGASAVLNAADEIAVQAFLDGRIGFLGIAELAEATLSEASRAGLFEEPRDLEDIDAVDLHARDIARAKIQGVAANSR